MATANKHRERSRRSYRRKQTDRAGFWRMTYQETQTQKLIKSGGNKSYIDKMFGMFKGKKGDK